MADISREDDLSTEKGGLENATTVGSNEQHAKAGELGFEEATRGGMGRHLGITSTIFLM